MKLKNLGNQIALGEDSTRQFKVDVKNAESLASEMAAFANTGGGTIFIGVADDGSMPGLSGQDVARHQSAHQQCRQSIGAQPTGGADLERGAGKRSSRHRADRTEGNR
jgi:predicted HTH transcriptional regulator